MSVSEDIQVGCRELRAKRFISDGFCTSTKPIKEVVCAGNCLPIMDLPWYAEFVKVWARSKLREWQCEEDVVRRKSVHLLCRNGQYRTYRIKVVKSCKCKNIVDQHNRTVPKGAKKKKRRKGKKDKRRKGKKRRGQRRSRKQQQQQVEEVEEEEEEVDVSQANQRQEASEGVKERRGGRKKNRKRKRERKTEKETDRKTETNSGRGRGPDKAASSADAEQRGRNQALVRPAR